MANKAFSTDEIGFVKDAILASEGKSNEEKSALWDDILVNDSDIRLIVICD